MTKEELHTLLTILSPVTPHICEEMNELLGYETPLYATPWPTWDESALVQQTVEYGIQVNGKIRARVELPADMDKDAIQEKPSPSRRYRTLPGARPSAR